MPAIFAAMIYKTTTAAQAVLHFSDNVFSEAFRGVKKDRDNNYRRAYGIIQAARAGTVSDKRARWLLETYGGQAYRVNTCFEVAVPEPNGPAFKSAIEKIWAENEGEETETKL